MQCPSNPAGLSLQQQPTSPYLPGIPTMANFNPYIASSPVMTMGVTDPGVGSAITGVVQQPVVPAQKVPRTDRLEVCYSFQYHSSFIIFCLAFIIYSDNYIFSKDYLGILTFSNTIKTSGQKANICKILIYFIKSDIKYKLNKNFTLSNFLELLNINNFHKN